jgi:hypothetical protein
MSTQVVAASPHSTTLYSRQIQRCDAAWAVLHEKVWDCFLSFLTSLRIRLPISPSQTFLMMTTENLPDGQFCWRWNEKWLAVTSFSGTERSIIEKAFRISKKAGLSETVTVPSFSEAFSKLGFVRFQDIMFLDARAIKIWEQITAPDVADKETLYKSLQLQPEDPQPLSGLHTESTYEFYVEYTIDPLNRCIIINKLLAPDIFVGLAIEAVFRKSKEMEFEGQIKIKIPMEKGPEYAEWGFLPHTEDSQALQQMEQMVRGLFSMASSDSLPTEEDLQAQEISLQCSLSSETFGMWNEILKATELQQKQHIYGRLSVWAQKTRQTMENQLRKEIPGLGTIMEMMEKDQEPDEPVTAADEAIMRKLMGAFSQAKASTSGPETVADPAMIQQLMLVGMQQGCSLQKILLDTEKGFLVATDLDKIEGATFREKVTNIVAVGKDLEKMLRKLFTVKIDVSLKQKDEIASLGFIKDASSSTEDGKVRYLMADWAQPFWQRILNSENSQQEGVAHNDLSLESTIQLALSEVNTSI